MKKRISLIALLILVLICSIGCLAACGGGGLVVTAESNGNGTVTLSTETAMPGESVTVTLAPDDGYCVERVLMNDKELDVEDNRAVFYMPNTDAHVKAEFGKIRYKLEIKEVTGGVIVYDEAGYPEGESVTLEVKPYYGYSLASLTVDGSAVTVTDNKYTFSMPAKSVSVAPAFTTSVEVKTIPSGNALEINSQAPAGGAAKALLFVEFGGEALMLKAFVSDGMVVANKDGFNFCFGTTDYANGGLSDANLKVGVLANGSVSASKAASGAIVDAEQAGITAEVAPWSKEVGKIAGYEATVNVPYSALGVTAANADGKLTLLPVLVNADKDGGAFGATEGMHDSYCSPVNADTYPKVTSQGFVENYFMFGKGAFGAYKGTVEKGEHWNTQEDYDAEHPNYADRKVTLNGHDGRDNNIAFTHTAGKTSFAKATFKLSNVYNANEKYPKFGFMIYDTATRDSGVFLYVDAEMGKDSGNTVSDVAGTALGYARQSGGSWISWTKIAESEGSFNLGTKQITLAVTYNKGFIYFYLCTEEGDEQVAVAAYKTKGDIVIGVKSFGLGLEVTDYYATNDPDDAQFKGHNSRIDGVTVGDSEDGYAYTEGWTIVGDVATNNGSGDQKIYVKGARESADLYAEATAVSPSKVTNSTDKYTKAGMMLESENYIIFGYTDLRDDYGANSTKVYFAVRYLTGSKAGQWVWDLNRGEGAEFGAKEVKLGIAKLGATVYLLHNGRVITTYTDASIANEKFVAGALCMNRVMTVSEGSGLNDAAQIKDKLGMNVPENFKFDGVLDDDIWTQEVLDSKLTYGENKKVGTKVEVAAVTASKGVFVAVTLYTRTTQKIVNDKTPYSGTTHVSFKLYNVTEANKNLTPDFIAFYNGIDGGVTPSVSFRNAAAKAEEVTLAGGETGYKTTVEFYIPFEYFEGYTAGAQKLPFYVWTLKMDGSDLGAGNASYKTTATFVTANGLVTEQK